MPEARKPESRSLGPVGDRILFENDTIRVWSVALAPGGVQAWHKHELPYLIVPLTPGQNEMEFEDGRIRQTVESIGGVLWREAGIPHELRNTSAWDYANVLIEFKAAVKPQS